MKKTFFKLTLILSILLMSAKCAENKGKNTSQQNPVNTSEVELREIQNHLDTPYKYQSNIPVKFGFCNSSEALLPAREYNTITGIAFYSIPFPKGSNLKFQKVSNDTIYYSCDGHNKVTYGEKDLMFSNRTKSALPRKRSKTLYVTVAFKNFKNSDCEDLKIFSEKKKTSEVSGVPLLNDGTEN